MGVFTVCTLMLGAGHPIFSKDPNVLDVYTVLKESYEARKEVRRVHGFLGYLCTFANKL